MNGLIDVIKAQSKQANGLMQQNTQLAQILMLHHLHLIQKDNIVISKEPGEMGGALGNGNSGEGG